MESTDTLGRRLAHSEHHHKPTLTHAGRSGSRGRSIGSFVTRPAIAALARLRHRPPVSQSISLLDGSSDAFPLFAVARPLFERELCRARRYERTLAVMALDVHGDAAPEARLAPAILRFIRRTDVIATATGMGPLLLALPETERAETDVIVARLQSMLSQEYAVHLHAGVAVFPFDALILEDLVALARHGCEARHANASARPATSPWTARNLQPGTTR